MKALSKRPFIRQSAHRSLDESVKQLALLPSPRQSCCKETECKSSPFKAHSLFRQTRSLESFNLGSQSSKLAFLDCMEKMEGAQSLQVALWEIKFQKAKDGSSSFRHLQL